MSTDEYLYNRSTDPTIDQIVRSSLQQMILDELENMTSTHNDTSIRHMEIPTHNFTDYVEMILYVLMSVGGGAVNVFCARRLVGQYRRKTINQHQVGSS